MGNYFKSVPLQKYDESLILFLKTKTIVHINDAIEQLNEYYPTSSTLNFEEFQDAFCQTLEDRTEQIFTLLENNHKLEGQVDVYESLAIVFSGEEFQIKLEFIFRLFDFDRSGEIEKKELILTLQSCIRALCKLVHIVPPELRMLEFFAEKVFIDVDIDKSESISLHEYFIWLLNSWELQNFLLQYAMIQTWENADRRTKEMKIYYQKLYEIAAGAEDAINCETESLRILFQKEFTTQKPEVIELLLKTIVDSSREYKEYQEGFIYKPSYVDVMSCWAAFDATDINVDNQASITELKYLLYAYEGDKPDVFRVTQEMQILDKDNSGFVSREEWIQYLCISEKGRSVFRGNLKNLFNKYDKDNSGSLTITEIKTLLTDSMRDLYLKFKFKGEADLANFEGMINSLAEEIIEELNSEEDKQNNDRTIQWVEFKNFMENAYAKQEKLRGFLKQF